MKSVQGIVSAFAPVRSLASAALHCPQHFTAGSTITGWIGLTPSAEAGMSAPLSASASGASACFGGLVLRAGARGRRRGQSRWRRKASGT